ncbi:hypothetical protein C0Q70_20356 [Pomacea canaliculata]|uniref:Uncharacterized protein n=1 Tax=Pomacea canaliculata TaxID=400727 RepID=A0A2T7NFA8_POMCA|nr:hypothetical protein C0Q70_20356 [Pomacea canaliculata]
MIRRERREGEDCGRGRGAARYVHGMPETSSTLSTSLSSCRCKCLMSLSELSGADASRNIFITAQTRGRWAAGDQSEQHAGLENVQTRKRRGKFFQLCEGGTGRQANKTTGDPGRP